MLENVRDVVGALGGPTALARKLERFGKIEPNAISMWCARGAVPGRWHLPLIQIATGEGMQIPFAALMQSEPAA